MYQYEDDVQIQHSAIFEEEVATQDPTYQELIQYAQVLGIDPQTDKQYMYIVKEALKEPLPENWRIYRNRYGQEFYLNINTDVRQKDFPTDEKYRKKFLEAKERDTRKKHIGKTILPENLRLDHQPKNQQLEKKKNEISKQYAKKEIKMKQELQLNWKTTQKEITNSGKAAPVFQSSGQDLNKLKSQLKERLLLQYQDKLQQRLKQLKERKEDGQLNVVHELNQDQLKSLRAKFDLQQSRLASSIAEIELKEQQLFRNKVQRKENMKRQILDSNTLLKAQMIKIQRQAREKVQSKKIQLSKRYQSYRLSIMGDPQALLNQILEKKKVLTQLFESKLQFQKESKLKLSKQDSRGQFQRLLELKKGLLSAQFSCKLKDANEKSSKQLWSKMEQLQKSKQQRLKLLQQQSKSNFQSRKLKFTREIADKQSKYTNQLLNKRQQQNLQELEIQKKQLVNTRQQLLQEASILKERIKFLQNNMSRFRLIKEILQRPSEEQQRYLRQHLQKLENRPMSAKMKEQKSRSIVEGQTAKLNSLKERLLQDKKFIKKVNQYIQMDQERVRISVRDINNSFLQELSKQVKIDGLKKGFQSIVVQFNQDVSRSRKNQELIKAYERAIQQLAYDNLNFESKLAKIIKLRPSYSPLRLKDQFQNKKNYNQQLNFGYQQQHCISTSQSVRILSSHRFWIQRTKAELNSSLLALKGINMSVF